MEGFVAVSPLGGKVVNTHRRLRGSEAPASRLPALGGAPFPVLVDRKDYSRRYRVGPVLAGDVVLPFFSFNSFSSSGSSGSDTMSLWMSAFRFR